jgi:hypothetical protein
MNQWLACWVLLGAASASPDQASPEAELLQRIDDVAPYRSLRLAPGPPEIPRREYERVARGRIITGLQPVEGHAAKKAYGAGLVDVPIGLLWAVVNDELHHPGYTKVEYAELVDGAPCESGRAVLQFMPVPVIADRWWITHLSTNDGIWEASGGKVRELSWTSTVDPSVVTSEKGREVVAENTPVGFTRGGWLLVEIDEARTLLEYYIWTDPGGRIPKAAANLFAAGGIKDAIEAMEQYANEAEPTCPIQ